MENDRLSEHFGAVGRRFVLHWGEMGWRWGVNRTVSQLHALLFLAGRPMHAEEIAEILQVARSNVSNSLRELQNWDLVRMVHEVGDRRDRYETARDPWELLRIIVRERKEREFDPTVQMLRECAADPALARLEAGAQKRLRDTWKFQGYVVSDCGAVVLRPRSGQLRLLSGASKTSRNGKRRLRREKM